MKSPAVIYALKIQKETNRVDSPEFESEDGAQIQSKRKSFEPTASHQGFRVLIILFFILFFLCVFAPLR